MRLFRTTFLRILGRILMTSGGVAFGLLLGEGALRLAAPYVPSIYNLVNVKPDALRAPDIQTFLKLQGTFPHRKWRGYFNNSWGMNDKEFPESGDRIKIAVLGDSQTYGMTDYESNNVTIAEKQLNNLCKTKQFDIYNLGIPGLGVMEYQKLYELTADILKPQIVILNFYMGNDSPDTYRKKSSLYPVADGIDKYFIFSFIKNSWLHFKGFQSIKRKSDDHNGTQPTVIAGGLPTGEPIPNNDQLEPYIGPTFTDNVWPTVARNELNTLYSKNNTEKIWKHTLAGIDSLKNLVESKGAKFSINFIPSEIQINSHAKAEAFKYTSNHYSKKNLSQADYDSNLPNATLKKHCEVNNIKCLDLTPVLSNDFEKFKQPLYIKHDTHLNLRGNQIIGDSMAEYLNTLYCQ